MTTIILSLIVILTFLIIIMANSLLLKSVAFIFAFIASGCLGIKTVPQYILKSGIAVEEVYFYCPKCEQYSSSKQTFCTKCGEKFDIWEDNN